MNAPLSHQLPADTLEAMQQASLDDKYTLSHGQAFMSGVQALVRLPMMQQQLSRLAVGWLRPSVARRVRPFGQTRRGVSTRRE